MTLPWTPEDEAAYLAIDEARTLFEAQLNQEANSLVAQVVSVFLYMDMRITEGEAANLLTKFQTLLPALQKVESSVALQQRLTYLTNQ